MFVLSQENVVQAYAHSFVLRFVFGFKPFIVVVTKVERSNYSSMMECSNAIAHKGLSLVLMDTAADPTTYQIV